MHSEPSLGKRNNDRAGGRIAYLLLEFHTFALERGLPPRERGELAPFTVPVAAAGNDRRRNDYEYREAAGNAPAAALYSSFRHARNRALRARGFRAISSSPATMAFRVIGVPSARPLHVHAG